MPIIILIFAVLLIGALVESCNGEKKRKLEAEKEAARISSQLTHYSNENSSMRNQNATFEVHNANLTRDNADLERENTVLKREIEGLRNEKRNLDVDNVKWREAIRTKKGDGEDL